VVPAYNQITESLGNEIVLALQGTKTAAQALKDASDECTAILKQST
jgi:maltose-binding protein MalE